MTQGTGFAAVNEYGIKYGRPFLTSMGNSDLPLSAPGHPSSAPPLKYSESSHLPIPTPPSPLEPQEMSQTTTFIQYDTLVTGFNTITLAVRLP